MATEAIRRLQSAAAEPDQPWFIALGFVKPHLPFCAPKKYWEMHDASAFKLAELRKPPEGAPRFAPQFGGELRQYRGVPDNGPISDEMQRELIHGYYAAACYMDAQLGRVIDALDNTGLAQNTIIVLWGDHGWHLGDYGMWCKHTNYEQAARIPLIIVTPRGKAGEKTASLVESVDVYPTLSELAGLPAPHSLEGKSLVPVLKDASATGRDHVVHVYPRGDRIGRAIRTARYRLVEWKKPGESADQAIFELYDYERDLLERQNQADEQPTAVTELRTCIVRHPEAKPQLRTE